MKLCRIGIGMPSFFNETVVTSSLETLDIPRERAEDWCVIGCYEASTQGDCYPLTVAGGFVFPDLLWDFLNSGTEWNSFDIFVAEFKNFFANKYENELLPDFETKWDELKKNNASPFESVCVTWLKAISNKVDFICISILLRREILKTRKYIRNYIEP